MYEPQPGHDGARPEGFNQSPQNAVSSLEQFDRFLQKLRDSRSSRALLTADEASIITLPSGNTSGAVIPLSRLESIIQSLPPERISGRHVTGQTTALTYEAPSGCWNIQVHRGVPSLCLEVMPLGAASSKPAPAMPPATTGTSEARNYWPPASDTTPIDNLIRNRPNKKRFPVALAGVLGVLLLGALSMAAFRWNQDRVEQERLRSVRSQLKALVLADNALALEILEIDESSHITYAEFFKRAEKNRDQRSDLIRRIRAIESAPYSQDVQNFVRLMELETEFVRCAEAVTQQNMAVSARFATLTEVTTDREEARRELSTAYEAYMATPYGEDYSEKFTLEMAAAKAKVATSQSKAAVELYHKAKSDLRAKMDATVLSLDDWMKAERRLYPWSFAPPRNLMDALIKKKSKYIVQGTDKDNSQNKTVPSRTSIKNVSAESAEDETPSSSSPTRVRSKERLDGERFPETRMRRMTTEDLADLTEEDIRYAINEMYARYGMTFKDKDYQANFDGFKWYQANDKWTPSQIERAFNDTERANLATLIEERSYRQSDG